MSVICLQGKIETSCTTVCFLIFFFYNRGDLNNALNRALEEPPRGRHLEQAKVKYIMRTSK
jgi:hypothetical protein